MAEQKNEELTAVFESEHRRREDWCVILLDNGTLASGTAKPGELIPGVSYRFIGQWEDRGWGKQFKFKSYVQAKPHGRRGVVLYLEKFAPGIGPSIAQRLCDKYGPDECLGILKSDPERIASDGLLTLAKAKEASEELKRIEGVQDTKLELMELLDKSGIYSETIEKLIARDGAQAATRLKADPFSLLWPMRMPGAGFSRVDTLYQKLGHPSDGPERQIHCCVYAIEEDQTGSVWVSFSWIERYVSGLVTGNVTAHEACEKAIERGMIIRENRDGELWYAIKRIGEAEKQLAERAEKLLGDASTWQEESKSSGNTLSEIESMESSPISSTQCAPHCVEILDF